MSQTITITVEDHDYKAFEHVAFSVQDWVDNFVSVRAEKAKTDIIAKLVAHCNANSIALATGEAAQITQAYDLGVIDTAANVKAASQAESQE